MTYRSWKFEDILKISELEKECFSDPWTYRMFVEGFSSKLFYGVCAVEDGEIVGYACETVLFENAEVDNIAVAEKEAAQKTGNGGEGTRRAGDSSGSARLQCSRDDDVSERGLQGHLRAAEVLSRRGGRGRHAKGIVNENRKGG